ncbi:FHA domain-containing protein [Cellulomonas xiejunii]|uniref:FHA domain-containing protein n=1 Tax=Cellulomonas xiejunii TaxID=2968083 RepID=UPI001D0E378A|nr:FHA domain-containing protein [Cellulomonas xiejunii]MCC2313047.1 FHA domain-containing protein [Cellulomonas xiejunii]
MSDDRGAPDGVLPAYRTDGPDTTMTFGSVEPAETEAPAVGLTSDEAAAVHALPPTSALLLMQRGPSAGARFLLDAERTTAGRSTSADIFLDDVTVSRKHAEFVRDGQQFVVRDIGSLNGTYVNRARIDAVVLRPGDEVQIGKYRMTFHPSPHRDAS